MGCAEKFYVIDQCAVFARDAGVDKGRSDGGGGGDELCAVGEGEVEGVVSDEEEPVSGPGNIAGETAVARDLDGDGGAKAIAWNIGDGDAAIFVEVS